MLRLSRRDGDVRAAGRAWWVSLVLGLGLLGLAGWDDAAALAQEPDRGSATKPGGAGVRVTGGVDTSDGGNASEGDGQGGTSPSEAREQASFWMDKAWGPVVTVTIVIGAMSFYLIALIIWMALHFRTSIAVPRELVHDLL